MIKFILLFTTHSLMAIAQEFNLDRIQPYRQNPWFWQYQGEPILLFGGSSDDNLFQIQNLEEELNLISLVGGNYVRNTMSSRDQDNLEPFVQVKGQWNPDTFNQKYWDRLDNFLQLTRERQIIVQIEVWAFHDFTWHGWLDNPWNPANNTVLTEENTRLKSEAYGNANTYQNQFFFSVPQLNNDRELLNYQQKFVDKLLSISLKYDHVLYCITNEIFTQYSPEWGWYWASYIKEIAEKAGKGVEVTEMFQNIDVQHDQHKASLDHPEIYSFVELSQNSTMNHQEHWSQLQWVRSFLKDQPRPINHVKTYGGSLGLWTDGPAHGIERFWRNIVGGAASVRFHRPDGGIGISEWAQQHIKSASMLVEKYDFFSSTPDIDSELLMQLETDKICRQEQAYLAYNASNDMIVYFPDGGKVVLDLREFPHNYKVEWLNVEGAQWFHQITLKGGGIVELKAPFMGNWIALLLQEKSN